MDPITLGLIGAGIGLAKNEIVDKPREKRERELAAKTAMYSPWTGMTPNAVKESDAFGTALQGGLAGFQLGQGAQTQNMQNQYMQNMMGPSMPMSQPTPMGDNWNYWQDMYPSASRQRVSYA